MASPNPIAAFSHKGRETHSIASELEGVLLVSKDLFPYLMLVAFEAGGPLRFLLLFLIYPFIWSLSSFGYQDLALRVAIFVSMAGIKMSDVKAVAKASLSRFFLEDLGKDAFMVFDSCRGKRHVVTGFPRVMVEPFLREYLDVDSVIGTEVRSTDDGYCLGLLASPERFGFLLRTASVSNQRLIDVGLCSSGLPKRHFFMSLCREKYVSADGEKEAMERLPASLYPKPLIFHDGRLVAKPTPANVLVLILWLPFGIFLATTRLIIGLLLPYKLILLCAAATGLRIRVDISEEIRRQRTVPDHRKGKEPAGRLYVCSHRTLLDPVMISCSLQRRVMAVTYSLSRVSEIISPIPNFRLSRDRVKDGEMMRSLLAHGDLVVCPEGTTCREPYLLRFSPLFAEIVDEVVPVAVTVEGVAMFYGTTVRGYKCLDSFFFLMNPMPCYRLKFLEKVSSGKNSRCHVDAANHVQKLIGGALGFQCTNLTRRDKYRMIAGNDGIVQSTTTSSLPPPDD